MTYHVNDMVKSLIQNINDGNGATTTRETSYTLDPYGRINTITNKTAGTETSRLRYRFTTASDSPTSIQTSTDAGATWATTRYLGAPGIGMAGSVTNGTATWQLANLHGDIVATQTTSVSIDSYTETDEYGNAIDTGSDSTSRYGWLGTHQRSTDTVGGVVLMGARLYNPSTGAFASSDPVLNGNATKYGYPEDPINSSDLSGLASGCDDNVGCDQMWDACRSYGNYLRCKFLFYMLKHVLNYSTTATKNVNYQNAGRHFAFIVISAILIGTSGAKAVAAAHEIGAVDPIDSRRDVYNNSYALGWYGRHTSYAKQFVGHVRTTGDMERLFWHGVSLFKRGYMYGVCAAGGARYVKRGPCA